MKFCPNFFCPALVGFVKPAGRNSISAHADSTERLGFSKRFAVKTAQRTVGKLGGVDRLTISIVPRTRKQRSHGHGEVATKLGSTSLFTP